MPQPIDTAPRDGTRILGLDRAGWREMWWKQDLYEGAFWQDHFDSEPEPTCWVAVPTGNSIVARDDYDNAPTDPLEPMKGPPT